MRPRCVLFLFRAASCIPEHISVHFRRPSKHFLLSACHRQTPDGPCPPSWNVLSLRPSGLRESPPTQSGEAAPEAVEAPASCSQTPPTLQQGCPRASVPTAASSTPTPHLSEFLLRSHLPLRQGGSFWIQVQSCHCYTSFQDGVHLPPPGTQTQEPLSTRPLLIDLYLIVLVFLPQPQANSCLWGHYAKGDIHQY